MPPNSADDSLF